MVCHIFGQRPIAYDTSNKDGDEDEDDDDENANAKEELYANTTPSSSTQATGASIDYTYSQPTSPRTPPAIPTTIKPSISTSRISLEQLTQFSNSLIAKISSMIDDLRQEFTWSHQDVTQSFQEIRQHLIKGDPQG